MSAFTCQPEHFQQLAIFATQQRPGERMRIEPRYLRHPASRVWAAIAAASGDDMVQDRVATFYANTLQAENVRSVNYRYQDSEVATPITVPFRAALLVNPIDILKMCDCLEYQSCETDDWEQSAAFELLSLIRRAAIRALPGYEKAPWDYITPTSKAA